MLLLVDDEGDASGDDLPEERIEDRFNAGNGGTGVVNDGCDSSALDPNDFDTDGELEANRFSSDSPTATAAIAFVAASTLRDEACCILASSSDDTGRRRSSGRVWKPNCMNSTPRSRLHVHENPFTFATAFRSCTLSRRLVRESITFTYKNVFAFAVSSGRMKFDSTIFLLLCLGVDDPDIPPLVPLAPPVLACA